MTVRAQEPGNGAPLPAGPDAPLPSGPDGSGLSVVGERPPLPRYLARLWRRREFVRTLAASQVRAGNSRDLLGNLWLALGPLLSGAVYFVVFGLLLETSRGIEDFVGFLVVGIFLFQYSSSTIVAVARSLTRHQRLVQALTFPRMAVPVAVAVREAIAVVPAVGVMLAVVLAAPPVEPPTWHWLALVPVLALQTLFNVGVGLCLARLVAAVNDVANLLPLLMRGWLYLSGVFYAFDRYVEHPRLLALLEANPMHLFLELARGAVLHGRVGDASTWLGAAAWSTAALLLGVVVLWQGEEEYARE